MLSVNSRSQGQPFPSRYTALSVCGPNSIGHIHTYERVSGAREIRKQNKNPFPQPRSRWDMLSPKKTKTTTTAARRFNCQHVPLLRWRLPFPAPFACWILAHIIANGYDTSKDSCEFLMLHMATRKWGRMFGIVRNSYFHRELPVVRRLVHV